MRVARVTKMERKRQTLSGSRNALFVPCCSAILLAVVGIAELKQGIKIRAVFFCLVALVQSFIVPGKWMDYRRVKQGMEVYVGVNASSMRMPPIVSVIVTLLTTAFVGVCSAFIVYVVLKYFNTQTGWTVCGITLLTVWLFVGYCWHRILNEKPPVIPIVAQKQLEGVWPPAPSASHIEKD